MAAVFVVSVCRQRCFGDTEKARRVGDAQVNKKARRLSLRAFCLQRRERLVAAMMIVVAIIIVMTMPAIVMPPIIIVTVVMAAIAIPLAPAPAVPAAIVVVIAVRIGDTDISEIECDANGCLGWRCYGERRRRENRSTSRKYRCTDCFSHTHISLERSPLRRSLLHSGRRSPTPDSEPV